MANCTLTIRVKFPWWTSVYLGGVYMMAVLGLEPDYDKIAKKLVDSAKLEAAP